MKDKLLTFSDAVRLTGPRVYNLMVKPAGSRCNLDCHYCYYLDKAGIYGNREPLMNDELLEKFIRTYIEVTEIDEVNFNWHGGEPMIPGLDFYRKAVTLERKYAGNKKITNTLQTNGTLIDDEAARFFADNGFLIGISIDGPRDIHDKFRRDKGANPTFDRVMKGLEALYRAGASFNTMTTLNKASAGRGLEIYTFLKSIGSRYMQFMPVVEHVRYPQGKDGKPDKKARPHIVNPNEEGSLLAGWSINALDFGTILCDIFDYWVKHDVGNWFVNIFDCTLANWCGVLPGTCVYAETCGGNAIVEHNGDLYPCDHFVYPEYRLGNIYETPLPELMETAAQVDFGINKRNSLPRRCERCEWLFACHGECPKHRFNRTESGQTGLNALCDGYRKFYSHVSPYMDRMRQLLESGRGPWEIMSDSFFRK